MSPTLQVAVRMEHELLEQLDWLVAHASYENRAEAIRAAIAQMADRARQAEIDRQIVEAYTRIPQTDEETAWASSGGFPGLPDEDWSDLW